MKNIVYDIFYQLIKYIVYNITMLHDKTVIIHFFTPIPTYLRAGNLSQETDFLLYDRYKKCSKVFYLERHVASLRYKWAIILLFRSSTN